MLAWTVVAVLALQVAYGWEVARPLVFIYLIALIQLARQCRWRFAFYPGLAVGFLVGLTQLNFFYTIFSVAALPLWFVFAFWIGLFVAFARLALRRFGPWWGILALPVLWTGLEYFRSELYYLRFAWLTPGFAFADPAWTPAFRTFGVYGTGFLLMAMACATQALKGRQAQAAAAVVVMGFLALVPQLPSRPTAPAASRPVRVAGVQMEFPSENEVLTRLREVVRKHPEAELIVLSEYTFQDVVPQKVRNWCRANGRYLIVGGKEPGPNRTFHNTAYVIGPEGDIVFQQVKAVPIQFFDDGIAATRQEVWESPWGKIGICICYDLSYTRVTDALVNQKAEALIVPTMDVADWGQAQHELHARVAPARAAEYGIPIFRLASSGISQLTDATGRVLARAPCPGDGAFIAGVLELRGPGSVPMLKPLAPACTLLTAAFVGFAIVTGFGSRSRNPANLSNTGEG